MTKTKWRLYINIPACANGGISSCSISFLININKRFYVSDVFSNVSSLALSEQRKHRGKLLSTLPPQNKKERRGKETKRKSWQNKPLNEIVTADVIR